MGRKIEDLKEMGFNDTEIKWIKIARDAMLDRSIEVIKEMEPEDEVDEEIKSLKERVREGFAGDITTMCIEWFDIVCEESSEKKMERKEEVFGKL